MRGFKRWSLLALVIVQILCMNTMSVLAAKETNEEVEVSLSTNKSEYEQGEEIELFLNVTNCGKKDIENVLIETVVPSQYVIAEGYDYEETMDVLEVGKSVQLSLKYAEKTQVPEATITPEVTSMPETTVAPSVTAVPENTTAPVITATSENTQVPTSTAVPENTTAPEATATPENTQTPTSTTVPENTAVPNHTTAPMSTIAPQPTAAPQVTSVPASSGTTTGADNIQEVEVMLPNPSTSPKTGDESQGDNWWIMAIILVCLLGILGVIKSKKFQKYLSLFLCITVITTSINVAEVQAEEVQTNVARKTITVTESVKIAGEEKEISVVVSYDSVQEVSYYNFAVEGLNEEDRIVTLEDTIDLQGTIESNQIVTSVKCVIYSDVNTEKKTITANGTESWVVEALALDLGNNYITLTAYDEKGGCGLRTIKVVRNQETTGSIVVDNVNEHNCVEMLDNTFEITGTASANKEIVSISCTFNSAANEEIRSAQAEGTTEWKFSNLPLDIGTNYLTIMAMCVDGSVFTTEVNAVRYSTEIKLADNVVPINPNIEEEYIEIQQIYDQIIDVWTEDFDTEDTSDDELCLAMYESNPLYQKVLSGEIKEGDVIYIPENEFFLTGFTVTYLYADDNYAGEVEGYEASICQVMHVAGAGYADLFDNEQDICISAVEINEEDPIAFVYFPYATEDISIYGMRTMTLAGADGDESQGTEASEENDEDIVEGRKFQYQNISPEKIKITFEHEVLSNCELTVELDELVILDFDGKGSTKNDRLSLSGEICMEDINAIIGLEMHPEFLSWESKLIPKQVTSRLDYTEKSNLKVSYGGKVELKDIIEDLKLGFDNKYVVKLFGHDVELEGVDTSGRIYLASVGFNLVTMTGGYIEELGDKIEPIIVVSFYQTLDGSIEAEASLSIETEIYYKTGFNFQKTDFEGNLGSVEENRGTTNIPITIPALDVLGESEYELNIYDIEGKSKEEPYEKPEWVLNAGLEGKATAGTGVGTSMAAMICGIMPASVDVSIGIENSLSGKGTAKLSNYGNEENYLFNCLGEKVYGTLAGEYDFFSRLALKAKPNFKLAICVDDKLAVDVALPNLPKAEITLFEGGLSSQKFEGVVKDSVTNLPIPNATVVLKKYNSTNWGNKYEAETDDNGCFMLSNILVTEDSRFILEINKQDYEEIIEEEIKGDAIGGAAKEYLMVCTLEHPYVKGTVSVATEDGSVGEGLYYATVSYQGVSGTETASEFASAKTDSSGNFDIGYLPEGEYTVTVSRAGYKTETATVTLVINESGEADFVLKEETFKFSGHVYHTSEEGDASLIEGATVKLSRIVGEVEETYTTKTNIEGYFEFSRVLASNGSIEDNFSRYTLTVEVLGYKGYTDTVIIDKDLEKDISLLSKETVSLEECMVTLSQDNFTYDGTVKEPIVTVALEGELIGAENYTVSYENNIKAGTASVIITASADSTLIKGIIIKNFIIEAVPVELKEVKLFGESSAAIANNGDLYMWGRNDYYQLGDGTTDNRSNPVKVLDNVREVSCDGCLTAAITENNDLYMWGYVSANGSVEDRFYIGETPVKLLENVEQVVCGSARAGMITTDGSLYLLGDNKWGHIGDGTTINRAEPVKVLDNVTKVDCTSGYNTGALTKNGELYIWGYNKYGQIGDGTTSNKYLPIKVLDNVQDFWMSQYVSLALLEDGSLYVWGYNKEGHIGTDDGTTWNVYSPVKILDNVKSVSRSPGSAFTGAITEDGSLYMWGNNLHGQLGRGSCNSGSGSIVKVLDNVEQIICLSYYCTAAIIEDGSLYMWGNNESGKLGDGTEEDKYIPCKILDNVKKFTGGRHHMSATLENGEIYIWGDNTYGQLGNGSFEASSIPTLLEVYEN